MRLLFVGDVVLGRLVNETLRQEKPEYPWGDTLDIFSSCDFRVCNLECVISDIGEPWISKVFHFRSDAKNIRVLEKANINAVSLANNHVLDFGYEALLDMLNLLENWGVWYAGAGDNLANASAVVVEDVHYIDKTGKEGHMALGLMAFTDNEPQWEAAEERPGIYYVPIDLKDNKAEMLLKKVKEAKRSVDILVVSAHWGPNWGYRPLPEHSLFAKALIDAGADIIFGHSGHVFRGIEIYKEKPIIYCAGDFIDDYAVDKIERNDESFIYMIDIDKDTDKDKEALIISKIKLYPTVIKNFQAVKAKEVEKVEITQKMEELCREFKTKTIWQDGKYLEIIVS